MIGVGIAGGWALLILLGSCSPPALPGTPATTVDMVLVPAGPFIMGIDDPRASKDEKPARQVFLNAFHIDRHEVTTAQFAEFVSATGYRTSAEQEGQAEKTDRIDWRHPRGPCTDTLAIDLHPVVYISWHDAQAYCAWRGKRLPTEAEWEKAARGSDGRVWPWGNLFDHRANHWGSADGHEQTAPVGSYPAGASPFGAVDLAGNVWEWCADWYSGALPVGENPQGPATGQFKVLRGGSWINPPPILRSTNRFKLLPSERSGYVGCRCALSE